MDLAYRAKNTIRVGVGQKNFSQSRFKTQKNITYYFLTFRVKKLIEN